MQKLGDCFFLLNIIFFLIHYIEKYKTFIYFDFIFRKLKNEVEMLNHDYF